MEGVQQSHAPGGQRERRGAVSELTWPGAQKTIWSRYCKDSPVWGPMAGHRTVELLGVGASRKCRGQEFTVTSSDFS